MSTYMRDDIYYCYGCGYFFDCDTEKLVDVPYTDMPADFAIEVMATRQQPFNSCHVRSRSKKKIKRPFKGFGKSQ